MITPAFGLTATERVLPRLALDFTTASLDPRVTFTRTTSASNPATYIDSSGVITAATNNQPRFDYDPVTLVCKGLLIEESRTNSLLNSDTLSTQIVTVTAAVRTLSFYGTGSVTLSGAHTAVVAGTGAYPTRTTYSFTPTAGALTLTVAGTVQYAQLEAGAFATSYIPTTSAALTRNADVATMTGTNFSSWFNQTEGAITCQFNRTTAAPSSSFIRIWEMSDGTTSNRMRMMLGVTTTANYDCTSGGSAVGSMDVGAYTANTNAKITGAYKTDSFAGSQNGASPTTDTSGIISWTMNQLVFGGNATGGGSYLNGYVQKFFYYPQRLINNEVRAFSK